MAYYPVQVENLARYQTIVAESGEEAYLNKLDPEEKCIAETFIAHAREIRAERDRAHGA